MPRGKEEHRTWSYIIAGLLLLIVWHLASLILDSPALPAPLTVFYALIDRMRTDLYLHLLISALRVIYGIALAGSLAVPLGLSTYNNRFDRIIAPIVYLLYPIPTQYKLELHILNAIPGCNPHGYIQACDSSRMSARDTHRNANKCGHRNCSAVLR